MPKTLEINDEATVWTLLEKALADKNAFDNLDLQLGDWAVLSLALNGRELHGTIPARFLPALQEYQESIYRLYSYIKYREYGIRRLKDSEKQELELVFSVEKGSSHFLAPLADALEKVGSQAISRMTPTQLTVVICVVIVMLSTNAGWARWLKYKEDKNGKDITNRAIDALSASTQPKDARDELLVKAIKSSKASKLAFEGVDDANSRLALSMDDDDVLDIGGVKITGDELKKAVVAKRERSQPYSEDGAALLTSVDNALSRGYIVGVKFVGDAQTHFAKVDSARLTQKEVNSISRAIFKRTPVWVHLEGKVRHDKVVDTYIYSVRELSAKEKKSL